MERDLPLLLPPAPDADASSIRQGDRRFASRYLAMQLLDHHGLTDDILRALARAMSIKVGKEMGEPCTERYARKLRGADRTDPADAMHLAGLQSLSQEQRKTLHRILRRHGLVAGAREAVAVALGLVNDEGWRDQVTLHETGLLKPMEFDRAVRTEAEFIVETALGSNDLRARVEQGEEPDTAVAAVIAEQVALSLVAADRGTIAASIALSASVSPDTARRWAQRPEWTSRLLAEVDKLARTRSLIKLSRLH